MTISDSAEVCAFVDWGEEELELGFVVGSSEDVRWGRFPRSGEGLSALCEELMTAASGRADDVHVAIEQTRGAVVDICLDRGFHTYSINPKQLSRFRDRYRNSTSKSDQFDCLVGARSLRSDRDCFRALNVGDPVVVELRDWTRGRRFLDKEERRVRSLIRDQLLRYYPQFLDLGDLDRSWIAAVWALAPTPDAALQLDEAELEVVLKRHRARKFGAKQVLALLNVKSLQVGEGTVRGAVGRLQHLFELHKMLASQLRQSDARIKALHDELDRQSANEISDIAILKSLPGAGQLFVARLVAEAPAAVRQRDLELVRCISGAAPVSELSGKQENKYQRRKRRRVVRRYACNPYLREAIFHLGRLASQQSPYYRESYAKMRARGHSHGRACRQVADNLLHVAFAMLRTTTLYDPSRHKQQPGRTA